jgi:hypothetical protein
MKMDAYYIRMARSTIDSAIAKLTEAQNYIAEAGGESGVGEFQVGEIQKVINKLRQHQDRYAIWLANGVCKEEG